MPTSPAVHAPDPIALGPTPDAADPLGDAARAATLAEAGDYLIHLLQAPPSDTRDAILGAVVQDPAAPASLLLVAARTLPPVALLRKVIGRANALPAAVMDHAARAAATAVRDRATGASTLVVGVLLKRPDVTPVAACHLFPALLATAVERQRGMPDYPERYWTDLVRAVRAAAQVAGLAPIWLADPATCSPAVQESVAEGLRQAGCRDHWTTWVPTADTLAWILANAPAADRLRAQTELVPRLPTRPG